ncbi:MAG: glycosyltransferase 87 family protein [Candidatus Dormibacteria bacterium]
MPTALSTYRHLLAVVGLFLGGTALLLTLAYFRPVPFGMMLIATAALVAVAIVEPGPELLPGDTRYPAVLGLFGLFYGLGPMSATGPQRLVLLIPVILIVAAAVPAVRPFWFWAALAVLLVSHVGHILETAGLRSDVNILFVTAVHSLVHGHTVYSPTAVTDGPPIPFTYPPGALVLLAPSVLLAGDARWALVGGELVACVTMWVLLPRREGRVDVWRQALLLIPLALPRVGEYFFEAANHEWVVLAVTALLLLAIARRREVAAGLLLALALSTKQTALLYPGAFIVRFVKPRMAVLAAGLAVASVAPFLVQDFHGTITGVLDPGLHGSGDYPNRLHVYAALVALGLHPGRAVQLALQAVGLAAGFLLWRRASQSPARALTAAGAAWIVLVILSPFAGYNYYAYGIALCAWGLALQVSPPAGDEVRPIGG